MKFADLIDSPIKLFAPGWALKRAHARHTLEFVQQQKQLRSGKRDYKGARRDRFFKRWLPTEFTGDVPTLQQLHDLRRRSWDLNKNNPYINKGMRVLGQRISGAGLRPDSLALTPDGLADTEFRYKANEVWRTWSVNPCDVYLPGGFLQAAWIVLLNTAMSGDCLIRRRFLDPETKTIPYSVQLLEAERLDEIKTGTNPNTNNVIFRGVELENDRPVAYWIHTQSNVHPKNVSNNNLYRESERIPADEIIHVFFPEYPGQVRGVPWFASILDKAQMLDDFQFNELVASTFAACYALWIETPYPTGGGLAARGTDDSSDDDGNLNHFVEPGQIYNLPTGAKMGGFQPGRPQTGVDIYTEHMLMAISGGMPGVKPSQLHGNYRGSSYSSERSAELDAFPEIEFRFQWFANCVLQPIYTDVINVARQAGVFGAQYVTPTTGKYDRQLTLAKWTRPKTVSIDPSKDIKASGEAVRLGLSSHAIEAGKLGNDVEQVLQDTATYLQAGKDHGVPDEIVLGSFGIVKQPPQLQPVQTPVDEPEENQDEQEQDTEETEDNEN